MERIFRLTKAELPAPAPGERVVKAKDCAELYEANRIVEAAQARAREILDEAERAYKKRYEEGYAEGLEAGKLENAQKVMETVLASVEFIEHIESTVVSVVTQSIRKIVGEMEDEKRIVGIVQTALNNVRGEQKVTVRVSPKDEPAVNRALAAMTAGSYLVVVADPRLSPDSCILESDLGVIDASLSTQLKALENAFHNKIGR